MFLHLRRPAVLAALLLCTTLPASAQIVLRRNEAKLAPFHFNNGRSTLDLTARGQLLLSEQNQEYGGNYEIYWRTEPNVTPGPNERIFMILQGDNNLCIYRESAKGGRFLIWNSGIQEDPRIECVLDMIGPCLVIRHAQPEPGGKEKWKVPPGGW
jgi:hypothetical protein